MYKKIIDIDVVSVRNVYVCSNDIIDNVVKEYTITWYFFQCVFVSIHNYSGIYLQTAETQQRKRRFERAGSRD